jgi:hypothetical protein
LLKTKLSDKKAKVLQKILDLKGISTEEPECGVCKKQKEAELEREKAL